MKMQKVIDSNSYAQEQEVNQIVYAKNKKK